MGLFAKEVPRDTLAKPRRGGLELPNHDSIAEAWRGKVVAWDRVRLRVEGKRAWALVVDEWGEPEKVWARAAGIGSILPRYVELPRTTGPVSRRLKERAWRQSLKRGTYDMRVRTRGLWVPRLFSVVVLAMFIEMLWPSIGGMRRMVNDFSELPPLVGATCILLAVVCMGAMLSLWLGLMGLWWLPFARRVRLTGVGVEAEGRRGRTRMFAWERMTSARELASCWLVRFRGDDGKTERVWVFGGNGAGRVLWYRRERRRGRVDAVASETSARRKILWSAWWLWQVGGVLAAATVWVVGWMMMSLPGGSPVPVWVWWPKEREGGVVHPLVMYLVVGVGLPLMMSAVSLLDRPRRSTVRSRASR